jgi:hypothetical protein
METNTFSLDEIRRELARLGYDGLSKQTLVKFQQDLEELAQNEKTQSMNQKFLYSSIQLLFIVDSYAPKRSVSQQQSNVDFKVK